jgi:cupin fold WbuC family metalloprotein
MNPACPSTLKTRAESAEVFYAVEEPVLVGPVDIEALQCAAAASPRRRARICTHANPAAKLHEMLIVLRHDSYVRPHKHLDKTESFTVLDGTADVILFEDDGTVREIIPMGAAGSGRIFYYRISQPVFHMIVVRSESLLFHEVTDGPFRAEQTGFAPWSPDGRDAALASAYLASFPTS